jgi:hypothetical protein
MKIGTILENANGMRVVIGAGEEPRWLNTGEPVFSRLNPDEWTECEVRLPEPETETIVIHTGGVVRVNSDAGTNNRVIGCFS